MQHITHLSHSQGEQFLWLDGYFSLFSWRCNCELYQKPTIKKKKKRKWTILFLSLSIIYIQVKRDTDEMFVLAVDGMTVCVNIHGFSIFAIALFPRTGEIFPLVYCAGLWKYIVVDNGSAMSQTLRNINMPWVNISNRGCSCDFHHISMFNNFLVEDCSFVCVSFFCVTPMGTNVERRGLCHRNQHVNTPISDCLELISENRDNRF